jgi:hypothetical protein
MNRDVDVVDRAVELFTERGAGELAHPGGTLLEHLRRVHATLREWGEEDDVALAGLTHAAYGTDGFGEALFRLDERELLQDTIGVAAERIVYLYCACDRDEVYPLMGQDGPPFRNRFVGADEQLDAGDLRRFADITAANEIDVATHNPDLMARYGVALRDLFTRMRPHLSESARQACAATFGA